MLRTTVVSSPCAGSVDCERWFRERAIIYRSVESPAGRGGRTPSTRRSGVAATYPPRDERTFAEDAAARSPISCRRSLGTAAAAVRTPCDEDHVVTFVTFRSADTLVRDRRRPTSHLLVARTTTRFIRFVLRAAASTQPSLRPCSRAHVTTTVFFSIAFTSILLFICSLFVFWFFF